jgi:hypothetical protein
MSREEHYRKKKRHKEHISCRRVPIKSQLRPLGLANATKEIILHLINILGNGII